jgi:hypothetical protein
VGHQAEERAAFSARFPKAVLLHKGNLRSSAGSAFDDDVIAAVQDAFVPLVAAVVNTIDDALDRSDPGTVVWGQENIRAVRDLVALTPARVVVLLSDHGHVIDRGADAVTRPSQSSENRWRPASPGPGDGEVLVRGRRVAKGGGAVVLPWREELRYGPRKAGYHGGASPAEAVIPLIVLTSTDDDQAVPGWSGATVASPDWWREARLTGDVEPAAPAGSPRRRSARPVAEGPTLFDDIEPRAAAAPPALTTPRPAPLLAALLESDVYRQRRGGRVELADERVVALLTVLLAGDGRATMDTLSARAGVPAHRIVGTVTALRKLLSVEGYPVVDVDADGQTVLLNVALLTEQFRLGRP